MSAILTMTIGTGADEKVYSAAWISMYHTKAVSKVNRETVQFGKKAQEIQKKIVDLQSKAAEIDEKINCIKESTTAIEDVSEIKKLVEEKRLLVDAQIEETEYITSKTDELWDRKLNIIHEVFNEKFELIDLEKNKSSQEINEIFQKISDFANGIIRKN